ncbi:MAG: enoyl-CoA hydratase/isomerase family protein [Mesorhizobium sp.]|nr:enoyl-CoA hydratase/isomerase family protein [Mesorhizobium sp.]
MSRISSDASPGSDAPVLVQRDGRMAWITLNRPDTLNAMSPELIDALEHAVISAAADPGIRSIAITGSGRAFSAGGDLKNMQGRLVGADDDAFHRGMRRGQEVFRRIETLPVPVIAAVNGYAVAGGLELVLSCDIVVAAAGVKMGDGHAKYGVVPGGGSTARLPRRLPVGLAKQLLFTAELVGSETMRHWGLVNEVVAADQLHARVTTIGNAIADASPMVVRAMKLLVNEGLDQPIESALDAELEACKHHVDSADLAEGLAAFQSKRKPHYAD